MRQRKQSEKREETPTARKSRRAKRLWIAADVVAAATVGSTLWWQWLNIVPTIHIPEPLPVPSPNAFDTFARASSQIVEKDVIEGANSKADQLRKERKGIPYSNAEKAAVIADNAPALAALRSGFSQEYQHPTRRGFDALFPELTKFRQLARLLNVEGQVREASGDFAGAAQSRLDAMQLGIAIPRGGSIIASLVGIACEGIGRRPLWSLADKLTGPQARAAAKRLEEMEAQRVSFTDAYQEEKWSAEVGFVTEFRKWNTFQFCREMTRYSSEDGGVQKMCYENLSKSAFLLPLLKTSKTQVVQEYSAYMDSIIARSRLSYQAAATFTLPPAPADPINAVISPFYGRAGIQEADNRMQDSLIIAVLALRAYQAEQGSYPEDLNTLVSGGYLTQVPSDPFSSTGDAPLRYRRLENGKYLLYSIGPDGKDNDGTPIQDRRDKTLVDDDMKGDFVVGVNNVRRDKGPGQSIQ